MFQKKNDFKQELSSKQYYELAEEHRLAAKETRRTFLFVGLLTIAILAVTFLASLAWFALNSIVKSSEPAIMAQDNTIELRSRGGVGVHDDLFDTVLLSLLTYDVDDNVNTTAAQKDHINWLLADNSQMKNVGSVDWSVTSNTKERRDYAIEPGSEGTLEFYLVPHTSGAQTVQLELEINPYAATVSEDGKEVTSARLLDSSIAIEQYAMQYMQGHILFYLYENNNYTWIRDGKFTVELGEETSAEEEYRYVLYWIWPKTFAQIILKTGDVYLNKNALILTETERSFILQDMKEHPELYFYNSLTRMPLTAEDALVNKISEMHDASPELGSLIQNFVDLSSFYNQADEVIGKKISFITVTLSAEIGDRE